MKDRDRRAFHSSDKASLNEFSHSFKQVLDQVEAVCNLNRSRKMSGYGPCVVMRTVPGYKLYLLVFLQPLIEFLTIAAVKDSHWKSCILIACHTFINMPFLLAKSSIPIRVLVHGGFDSPRRFTTLVHPEVLAWIFWDFKRREAFRPDRYSESL